MNKCRGLAEALVVVKVKARVGAVAWVAVLLRGPEDFVYVPNAAIKLLMRGECLACR